MLGCVSMRGICHGARDSPKDNCPKCVRNNQAALQPASFKTHQFYQVRNQLVRTQAHHELLTKPADAELSLWPDNGYGESPVQTEARQTDHGFMHVAVQW